MQHKLTSSRRILMKGCVAASPLKSRLFPGDPDSHLIHAGFWAHPSLHIKRHLQRFSCYSRAHTDHGTSVTIGRIFALCVRDAAKNIHTIPTEYRYSKKIKVVKNTQDFSINIKFYARIHRESKIHYYVVHNSAKCRLIFKILSLSDSVVNLLKCRYTVL